jgi:hypothetical protein
MCLADDAIEAYGRSGPAASKSPNLERRDVPVRTITFTLKGPSAR